MNGAKRKMEKTENGGENEYPTNGNHPTSFDRLLNLFIYRSGSLFQVPLESRVTACWACLRSDLEKMFAWAGEEPGEGRWEDQGGCGEVVNDAGHDQRAAFHPLDRIDILLHDKVNQTLRKAMSASHDHMQLTFSQGQTS